MLFLKWSNLGNQIAINLNLYVFFSFEFDSEYIKIGRISREKSAKDSLDPSCKNSEFSSLNMR